MSSYNSSSVAKSQQWRNELAMEPSDQMPLNTIQFFKEFQKYSNMQHGQAGSHGQQGRPILAGHHGQQGRHSQPSQPTQPSQAGQPGQQDQHGQPGLKGPHGQPGLRGQSSQIGQPAQPGQPSQPGQQVLAGTAICCDQANCDQTKIEQIYPEQYMHEPATPFTLLHPSDGPQVGMKDGSAGEQFNMYCPCGLNRGQLVTICCTGRDCDESTKIDDIHMGPPEEKRAKTTYNQFKF